MSARVIARMTVIREVGARMIIEIQDDATFHAFYRIYRQDGRRHSTKTLVRTASRNEGLKPYYAAYRMEPGLQVLEAFWRKQPGVKSVVVRIIYKRAYRRLCSMAPDQLGLTQIPQTLIKRLSPERERAWIPVRMPANLPRMSRKQFLEHVAARGVK